MSENYNQHRVDANLAALQSLDSPNPDAQTLKGYTGWGGLREAVYTPAIFKKLKRYICDGELQSLKQTLKTAYYTPRRLVEHVYQCAIGYLDSPPQSMLEPSAGHGIFIDAIPQDWHPKITAVEMDTLSCRILKALYPESRVHQGGFEGFKQTGFDLIVGNPPFGQFRVNDTHHQDLSAYSIHHFFVGKAMRLLNPGGVLAMILPRYFLDASQKHVREIIAKEGGTLMEAWRLPDDFFSDAKVTIDLVVLKKTQGANHWLRSAAYRQDGKRAYLNQYFLDHPDHILGKLVFAELYGRDEITCQSNGAALARLEQRASQQGLAIFACKQKLANRLTQFENEIEKLKHSYHQTKMMLDQLLSLEGNLQTLCQSIAKSRP